MRDRPFDSRSHKPAEDRLALPAMEIRVRSPAGLLPELADERPDPPDLGAEDRLVMLAASLEVALPLQEAEDGLRRLGGAPEGCHRRGTAAVSARRAEQR